MSVIVIDAGHGGHDPGAVNGSRQEKDDNLRLAQALRRELQARGQQVIMTRDSDMFLPLTQRSAISNNNNADMFVSLHRNAIANNPQANGVENFVRTGASAAETRYAQNVLDKIVQTGVQNNRGVKQGNFSVLRNTRAPAMLLEMGFITNAEDNRLFDQNLNAYAAAIADGIVQSLSGAVPAPPTAPGTSQTIKSIQQTLNSRYGAGLVVDGIYGPNTKRALVRGLQTELNRQFNAGLTVDGVFGPKTKAAIPNLRLGDRGNLVYLLQAGLYMNGFPLALDSIFGTKTREIVQNFQRANGLHVDGIAGPNTFAGLFG